MADHLRHVGRFCWVFIEPLLVIVLSPIWVPVALVALGCMSLAQTWRDTARKEPT